MNSSLKMVRVCVCRILVDSPGEFQVCVFLSSPMIYLPRCNMRYVWGQVHQRIIVWKRKLLLEMVPVTHLYTQDSTRPRVFLI